MGNEAIQRRPRASKREVLPRYQALFCLKSLTHTEELYLFLILLSPPFPVALAEMTLMYVICARESSITTTVKSQSGVYFPGPGSIPCLTPGAGGEAAEVLLTN